MSKLMIFVGIEQAVSVVFGLISLMVIELFARDPNRGSGRIRVIHHAVNLLAGVAGIGLAVLFHKVTGLSLRA